MSAPRTLYEKIWEAHRVSSRRGEPDLLYIDLHLVHEVTSPQAFEGLRRRCLPVRRPDRTLATADHSTPTDPGGGTPSPPGAPAQVEQLLANCRETGVTCFGPGHKHQGIVHVIGPELGYTRPGMTIVCGDSHTATHGAFGALAFGIGTSEVEQVLATQCLPQRPARRMRVEVTGQLPAGVSAKDLALAVVAELGASGGTGHAIEYTGSAVRGLSMEGRMTLCNLSIEAGARVGLVAPDETTSQWLAGRPASPRGAAWTAAMAAWRDLRSDPGATWDRTVTLNADRLEPLVTYGTSPDQALPISGRVPDPADLEPGARLRLTRALEYMGLQPGQPLAGVPIGAVFIGSCTNGRLSDLRAAAAVLADRRVHPGVRALVVPGSRAVQQAAEAEGLDRLFRVAGAEWRDPGCSMCIAMNGDVVPPGVTCVATSNRNFENRQGPGARTVLAAPHTAAAAAVTGRLTDPRPLLPAGRLPEGRVP